MLLEAVPALFQSTLSSRKGGALQQIRKQSRVPVHRRLTQTISGCKLPLGCTRHKEGGFVRRVHRATSPSFSPVFPWFPKPTAFSYTAFLGNAVRIVVLHGFAWTGGGRVVHIATSVHQYLMMLHLCIFGVNVFAVHRIFRAGQRFRLVLGWFLGFQLRD